MLEHDWFPRPLPENVQIGPRSWLYSSFALVHFRSRQTAGLRIGQDSGIYNGTFFDLGSEGKVDIGNFCTVVGAIFSTNGSVSIGDYTFIAHEVVIADHFAASPMDDRQPQRDRSMKMVIGENVWIGARAILLGSIEIGEGAIIGAAATVTTNVPPYTIFRGNPARQVGIVRR